MTEHPKNTELSDEEFGHLLYLAISSKSSPSVRKKAYRLLKIWLQILKLSRSEKKREVSRENRYWFQIMLRIAKLRLGN